MKHIPWFYGSTSLAIALALTACNAPTQQAPASSKEAFVDSVLATMSIEDKSGEMTQLTLDMVCVGAPYALEEPHRLDTAKLQEVRWI